MMVPIPTAEEEETEAQVDQEIVTNSEITMKEVVNPAQITLTMVPIGDKLLVVLVYSLNKPSCI
ncbi:uncharacterized protein SPAPADRAFT_60966 [Spathaspora passalidarum NRRL Y-27907]|uniref:Uncharacterized protein n=1 Tax=Spathaspora passalidarum (strain NRRL Y-27907 / 11-Y1) TaxID=619300 RepID=G3AKM3_SPAPN|nr:uncharacterized protein SPAPADRAFT_60966 [Spathaspora passalidarum NRRL Y-27907]EGW33628.1 hypothetical protein SPAPADRAFT_60966 [Spathaspora passalidarum NRRL Y-27907]